MDWHGLKNELDLDFHMILLYIWFKLMVDLDSYLTQCLSVILRMFHFFLISTLGERIRRDISENQSSWQ